MDSTKYDWELDHRGILVSRTVPSGTLSPRRTYYNSHVAAETLGAHSSVYVSVRKPVKNPLTRSQTEDESEKTIHENPDDDDM